MASALVTDRGPLYDSHKFGKFVRRIGFGHRILILEDLQDNGFKEAFHTAVSEGWDPRKGLSRCLLIY